MSGIFSLFSGGRSGHQTAQTTTDEREAQVAEKGNPLATTSRHGIEVDVVEFRPVEHPVEPIGPDQPIRCPLSEPSILNDGRIWKERTASTNAPMKGIHLDKEKGGRRHKSAPRSRLPSLSAPGDSTIKLPEEGNGDRIKGS